jgi:menaquinone-dependent protoporphyrinogen oxidase
MTNILVAYASKHDSTTDIAKVIGDVLRQSASLQVDVQPVIAVKNITAYDAVILGSAVYVGNWQSEAGEFLEKHEKELAERRVWLFSSGPTGEGDPKTLLKGWEFPEGLRPLVQRIRPHGTVLFHGNLDTEKLSFVERVVVKGVKAPMGDFRDWRMIREWAEGIAQTLNETHPVL